MTRTVLLDVTRLVSRAGRPMTGVDRVEFAYLKHLQNAVQLYGLLRTSLGFMLLAPNHCAHLQACFETNTWPARDVWGVLRRRMDPQRARAEAEMRRHCLARARPNGIAKLLSTFLSPEFTYVNVGHTRQSAAFFFALQSMAARHVVMVHDVIPLDHPEHQRPETVAKFRGFLQEVFTFSDLILCNSNATATNLVKHAPKKGLPRLEIAWLGVDPVAQRAPVPSAWGDAPYFVILGTIEPRKNHALILEIWPQTAPAHLVIAGNRGWRNEDVFAQLDRAPDRVHEQPGLSDAQIATLLEGSAGLLFPSVAEGFGLPPMEAAALGVPVLCSDLPVLREVMGDIPIYAEPHDAYLWTQAVKAATTAWQSRQTDPTARRPVRFDPPRWDAHFECVLNLL